MLLNFSKQNETIINKHLIITKHLMLFVFIQGSRFKLEIFNSI